MTEILTEWLRKVSVTPQRDNRVLLSVSDPDGSGAGVASLNRGEANTLAYALAPDLEPGDSCEDCDRNDLSIRLVRVEEDLDKWRGRADAAAEVINAWKLKSGDRQALIEARDERIDNLKRERDAAVARAEQAEKQHTWPKVTPTGHTYVEPRTYEALRHEHDNAAQAEVECWDADECPPEPTWEMVGIAHREVERLQRDRDEWKARAEAAGQLIPAYAMLDVWVALGRDSIHFDDWYDEHGYADAWAELTAAVREGRGDLDAARENAEHYQAMFDATERQRDEWKARAEAAEARTAPAVTKAEIEMVIDQTLERLVAGDWIPAPAADAVWSLVSGADPVVHVVRESELPEVERDEDGWTDGTRHGWEGTSETAMECVETHLEWARFYAAAARAIEAEQAVDPVEEAAVAAFKAAWHRADEEGDEGNRVRRGIRAARHVLRQEAGDE